MNDIYWNLRNYDYIWSMNDIQYVIYCRRSSDESSNNQVQSIPDQIQCCIDFAKKEWLVIRKKPKDFSDFETTKEVSKELNEKDINTRRIYEESKDYFIVKESKSAKTHNNRPKRAKLIKMIERWEIKWLLSYSPDRQARNMIDWWVIIELADSWDVDLKYHSFHFINNASGRMMLGFWFVFSKQYSDKLSEDVIRWNKTRVGKGQALGQYKYWYYRDEESKLYKPHEVYFPLMKRAFQMRLYEWKTNDEIATRLNANGYVREFKNGRKESVDWKRLKSVRENHFYYGVYISGANVFDMRDWELNPFYKPMITEEEHEILVKRWKKNSDYAIPSKRKERYDEITPLSKWMLKTPDWYTMACYTPNPSRIRKRLEKAQIQNPHYTLKDVVTSGQIRCKCSTRHSEYQNFDVPYDLIENAIIDMFSTIKITDEDYKKYVEYVSTQLDRIRFEIQEKNSKILFEINKIKWKKTEYIKNNMHVKDRDPEEDRIYNQARRDFDKQIDVLTQDIVDLNDTERNSIKEFEIFIKILQKAPQYFKKATYVQKRKITDLTILNISVTPEKLVTITVRPWLEDIFDQKIVTGA